MKHLFAPAVLLLTSALTVTAQTEPIRIDLGQKGAVASPSTATPPMRTPSNSPRSLPHAQLSMVSSAGSSSTNLHPCPSPSCA